RRARASGATLAGCRESRPLGSRGVRERPDDGRRRVDRRPRRPHERTMKIAITGSSGLVGTALAKALEARGDVVLRLVRREPRGPSEVRWSPSAREVYVAGLAGVDAIVHLAGENIADGRWTDARKRS